MSGERDNVLNFNRNKLRGLVFFSSVVTIGNFIHMNEVGGWYSPIHSHVRQHLLRGHH